MSKPRILVCSPGPPNESADRVVDMLKRGNSFQTTGFTIIKSDGDVRGAFAEFEPHVVLLLVHGRAVKEACALLATPRHEVRRPPVIAVVAEGGPAEAFELLRAGAEDFSLLPLRIHEILPRIWRLLGDPWKDREEPVATQCPGCPNLVGGSPAFAREVSRLPLIADCDSAVLVSGETGTGKELFARAIHAMSPRADRPFVPVNCGAIPSELAESELFGHERGAFTGAHAARCGMIREADGGTLFLDEVSSLQPLLQVKLLRFLQEKEVRPLGATFHCGVDVRVIAAAHADLDRDVRHGAFRRDLYYRLNTIPVRLPPLRERKGDIPTLVRHFLGRFLSGYGRPVTEFSSDALAKLLLYEWPGNVRELEHVVERSVVMSGGRVVSGRDIDLPGNCEEPPRGDFRSAKARIVSQFERTYIEELLALHRGNISSAARVAGKNRRAFWELIRKHGILVEPFRK